MHIAIEGLDGVGKTTTAKALASELGFEFIEKPLHYFLDVSGMDNYLRVTHKINEEMDSDFAGMFYGAGNYYTSLMAKKQDIITDRHLASTYYWNSNDNNQMLFDFLVDKCGKPNLTIILFSSALVRKQRIVGRDSADCDLNRDVFADSDYDKILEFVQHYEMPYICLDTSMMGFDDVVSTLKSKIIKKLGLKN